MFPSREIDKKLCQNYSKIHIYIQFWILGWTDHIQQTRSQSKNDYIPQEPENLRFAPITIFYFLIDIIYNIITNSQYSL